MVNSSLPQRRRGFWPEKEKGFRPVVHSNPATFFINMYNRIINPYRKFAEFAELVNQRASSCCAMEAEELRTHAASLRRRLYRGESEVEIAADVFALVREQATRVLKQRHFDVQLVGGWVMLNGMVAEMATGEGKTLTATLPASFAALAGIPVHIITTNDYLAQRDADLMRPLYRALDLSVGAIQAGMNGGERKEVYSQDVVYCSNKEIVFDYLKDRLVFAKGSPGSINLPLRKLSGQNDFEDSLRLSGLHFAIVDEADSIFIDEARSPLILSQTGDCGLPPSVYRIVLDEAAKLKENIDFTLNWTGKSAILTPSGRKVVEDISVTAPALLPQRRNLHFLIQKALTALHLFANGREYIVTNGQIAIIGEQTGRIMPGRSWEMGLQQFIETKEGCSITGQPETLTKINFQKFFNKYCYLSGMTGTASEVQRELWDVYRLHVVTVPPNVLPQSQDLGCRLFRTSEEKNRAVLDRVETVQDKKRPILIGTASVDSSETLVNLLRARGYSCTLLNARQDRQEAEIIAQAGTAGQITVATNMAGRGTDIVLAAGVAELGGLHVLATECANSRRIDRQLFGRCGRQGDPGSYEAMFCLEDPFFRRERLPHCIKLMLFCLRRLGISNKLPATLATSIVQNNSDREQYFIRRQLIEQDTLREHSLSFNKFGE